jgi:hypothetical protein
VYGTVLVYGASALQHPEPLVRLGRTPGATSLKYWRAGRSSSQRPGGRVAVHAAAGAPLDAGYRDSVRDLERHRADGDRAGAGVEKPIVEVGSGGQALGSGLVGLLVGSDGRGVVLVIPYDPVAGELGCRQVVTCRCGVEAVVRLACRKVLDRYDRDQEPNRHCRDHSGKPLHWMTACRNGWPQMPQITGARSATPGLMRILRAGWHEHVSKISDLSRLRTSSGCQSFSALSSREFAPGSGTGCHAPSPLAGIFGLR